MSKKVMVLLLCCLLAAALFAGCGQKSAPPQPSGAVLSGDATGTTGTDIRTIVDGSGRQVEVPEKVESIVCLGVGALRYTCYVGGQDLVAGVED